MSEFTYGLELEFVDFDRRDIALPEGCGWARKEVTLVNSNGLATDGTGKTGNFLGGEINTPPTKSIPEQLEIAEKCLKVLKSAGATYNYRCNLQTHIGLPEEYQNLESLKKIQKYIWENYDDILMVTMGEGQFKKNPEMPTGAWAHYKERVVPPYKHDFLMAATDLKDFQMSMFKSKKGTQAPLTFMRQGINTHSYFKHKTIEFRIFWATDSLRHIEIALAFSDIIVTKALGIDKGYSTETILESFKGAFPPESPFLPELEKGFQKTKVPKPN